MPSGSPPRPCVYHSSSVPSRPLSSELARETNGTRSSPKPAWNSRTAGEGAMSSLEVKKVHMGLHPSMQCG